MSIYYKTGKVTITHGSTAVHGVGTSWVTEGITSGYTFMVDRENAIYEVSAAPITQTSITLTYPYQGETIVIGEDYSLIKNYQEGQYKIGTVSITNGETYVSGNGTFWAEEVNNVTSGSIFMLRGHNTLYYIDEINSNTGLTLTEEFYNSNPTNISGNKYTIVRDYTRNYNLPLVTSGDYNWDVLVTKSIREIDEQMYNRSTKLIRFVSDAPSGTINLVSGGTYYKSDSSIEVGSNTVTMYYDSYYNALLYSTGSMASASPSGGDENIPIWYTQWYMLEGIPV